MNGPSQTSSALPDVNGSSGALERSAFRFTNRRDAAMPDNHRPGATNTGSGASIAQTPVSAPKLKRPRGRILIGTLMLAACASGILTVWDNLFRYQAYGVVTGRVVEVATPIDGVLKYVHVREGDVVRQNTVLGTVSDLEYEQRLARIADELRIADATLHAEIARIQWQSHVDETEMTRAVAEFHEARGQVFHEVGTLDILRDQLDRTRIEREQRATTEADLLEKTIEERSHSEKLSSLQQSLIVLKGRAEKASAIPRLGTEQIEPLIAKADMLLNEIERIREWIAQGQLRAPINGIILRRHHPAGECVKSHEPMFAVMEESSTEIELFVSQEISSDFNVGDVIKLNIEPFETLVPCVITSIGAEHRSPPEHIEIFYRSNIKLLPIRLRPTGPQAQDKRLKVGAVARLPHIGARS